MYLFKVDNIENFSCRLEKFINFVKIKLVEDDVVVTKEHSTCC